MPDQMPKSQIRNGLIESAGGALKCPVCRELLEDVVMVSTTTDGAQTMVLPKEVRTYDLPPGALDPMGVGIKGVVVGLACAKDHHVFLSLVAADGHVTVKTEWEENQDD
jgi:hypothetical protein